MKIRGTIESINAYETPHQKRRWATIFLETIDGSFPPTTEVPVPDGTSIMPGQEVELDFNPAPLESKS
jgi:hypothetical protein